MRNFIPKISYFWLTLLLSLYFTFVVNFPVLQHFYQILHALSAYKIGFALSIPVVLFAALNFVFTPFTFKPLLKPFFIILLLISAIAAYAQLVFHVIFDRGMIENIAETQQSEASSYLNASVVIWFVLTGLLPALLLLKVPVVYNQTVLKRLGVRVLSMLVSLALIGGVATLYYKDYASVGRNNRTLNLEILPTNYLYSGFQYINHKYLSTPLPYEKVGTDAKLVQKAGEKPTLMFLVIGETGRAQNQSFNGYDKPTNSFTQKTPDTVFFNHVSSCGTATAVSVPCMFSDMKRVDFNNERAHRSDSFLDILQRAGVSVYWKDNDEGCKGVCDRVPNVTLDTKKDGKFCDGETCYDAALLENLDDKIVDDGKNKLIGLHLIGSHGPTYYQRYPDSFRFFMPDCERSDIENCSHEQLVNTYDNTVRYTDYVLTQVIAKAKQYQDKYNVVMIYLSDHGESLGEDGLYLHGTPYSVAPPQQTHVPMMFWLSPQYASAQGISLSCLQAEAAKNDYSQDNLFHTVLDAMDVKTAAIDPTLDIFKSCRTAQ
ncbi:phosphoethanolamine--lipid A transferase [Rouxiella sp. S1S-2]|uniref:phosphoethanolamine transferase n=1 Tax=Rouxiella sp. S1S-2 TaxID=2653856 RepID=UPI0012657D4B|nr:phosphoethanolamine--lipid A transferase [Rouxiella sp. S1S-2]KAB7897273.1 phosphoethanolamine--lipid A transferase [Rouxiella sp. S1S-2]